MKTIWELFIKHKAFIFVIFAGLLSVLNLFHAGLPPTHDGEYHVIRFYEFDKSLRDGNWYPFWAADLNYRFGSPLFNYVYPLPNYLASFFHAFGASFIDTFKINLILASIFGAITAYVYARRRFGEWGGVVTSIFYTYAPYHFLDIYIRGSVGEVWALALFPLGLYFLDKVSEKATPRRIVLGGIAIALIIFSHNILALMFAGFAFSYILLLSYESKTRKKTFLSLCLVFILSFALSAIFFLPAMVEQVYVVGLKIFDPTQNFPEVYQLLIPSWGSGFSGGTITNEMSFQIGVANLFVIFLVVLGLMLRKLRRKEVLFPVFFLLWIAIFVFLMNPASLFIWKHMPLMDNFQFPWRFLSLLILCVSILAGNLTKIFKSRLLFVFLIILCITSTYSYAKAPYYFNRADSHYITRENFIYGTNSIGNVFQTKWLPLQKKVPSSRVNLPNKWWSSISINTSSQIYSLNLPQSKSVIFNTAYFPGWRATVNGKAQPVLIRDGKIAINLPQGKSVVHLFIQDTPIRLISKVISIISVLFVILILFKPSVLQYFYAYSH